MASGQVSFAFSDALVVVTGAAGGIGAAIAWLFAKAGARVVAADRRPTATHPSQHGTGRLLTRKMLVDDEASIRGLFDEIKREQGHIDVLVNAAGITSQSKSIDLPATDWNTILAVNLTGTMLCSQAAARLMLAGGGGVIVNIASELALAAAPEKAAYIASKAGVIGLTRSLAVEWFPLGIRVNAVAPGATRTPMLAGLEANETERARYLERVPAHRFGEAEDIAMATAFLASDAAAHIVGQLLVVDGGYTIS